MKLFHQILCAVIYAATALAICWLAYKDGPSDAEMRIRASQPLSAP
jgi:hypothetical protein